MPISFAIKAISDDNSDITFWGYYAVYTLIYKLSLLHGGVYFERTHHGNVQQQSVYEWKPPGGEASSVPQAQQQ